MPPYFSRVVLIEDESAHATVIKRSLAGLVEEVTHFTSFGDAEDYLKDGAVDLVVTDLNLPDVKFGDHIPKLTGYLDIVPLVVLTSSVNLNDAIAALKSGASDYIVKNFDSSFRESVELALSRARASYELKKQHKEFEMANSMLRSAIENSDEGMAVICCSNEVVFSNTAFNDILKSIGVTLQDFEDWQHIEDESKKEIFSKFFEHAGALSHGAFWNSEVRSIDGSATYWLTVSVIKEGRDGGTQLAFWMRDVTEQKRKEKFQREILATTTHDLKGPVGAILVSAELLLDFDLGNDKAKQLALRIASSAQGTINLIDEFLSARRLQEGNYILKPRENNLVTVVEECVQQMENVFNAKGITLCSTFSEESIQGVFDKLAISRVINNLLSNAAKFTPAQGSVEVSVGAVSTTKEIFVSVKDTGAGMEPQEVKRVFDRFTRLEKHREYDGSGLGLYVVKCIVDAHEGRVEVFSKPGEGSTFKIVIPKNPPMNERGEIVSLDFT